MRGWISSFQTSADRGGRPESSSSLSGGNDSGVGTPKDPSSRGKSVPQTGPGERKISDEEEEVSKGEDDIRRNRRSHLERGPNIASHVTSNIFAFGRSAASVADAEAEQRVMTAARKLADGVQDVVTKAKVTKAQDKKNKNSSELEIWKIDLLDLLGGRDEKSGRSGSRRKLSDIDVLLANRCEKFVLRCVENELPPNLIHCLRLLRMLECQNAQNNDHPKPISSFVTTKVSALLCQLCTDGSVGEQLRPHLFGLLALSGASYPLSGVHVARAANAAILSFCQNCLSSSLVWFLHEKKMVILMTDDLKELCGMSFVSSSTASHSKCLYGKDAEKADLWVLALKTLVSLVTLSCEHRRADLLQDFDAAGGYHVLSFAIMKSSKGHVPQLLVLVLMLVCCKVHVPDEEKASPIDNGEVVESPKSDLRQGNLIEETKLVTNVNAFEIVEDLMVRSIPFLGAVIQMSDGHRPSLDKSNAEELASFSVQTGRKVHSERGRVDESLPAEFNLASELLVTTLQLYSDHSRNYYIVEPRYNVLSYYLLSYPTFHDVSIKVLILKTLEYIHIGLAGGDAETPITVASEVFFSLTENLLSSAKIIQESTDAFTEQIIFDELQLDAEMLCATLQKLLQYDESIGKIMCECGLLDTKVNTFLTLVVAATTDETHDRVIHEKTLMDQPFSNICQILKLVVQQSNENCYRAFSPNTASVEHQQSGRMNLNVILTTAVKFLGNSASKDALSVFQATLSSQHSKDALEDDFTCLMDLLRDFSNELKTSLDRKNEQRELFDKLISRQVDIWTMIKFVMEANESAQNTFRTTGGFEIILDMFTCLEGCVIHVEGQVDEVKEEVEEKAYRSCQEKNLSIIAMVESIFGILTASVEPSKDKSSHTLKTESTPSSDSQLEAPFLNRQHLLHTKFYMAFSTAITNTGIFHFPNFTQRIMNLAIAVIEPSLSISKSKQSPSKPATYIHNPDAARLVLGLAVKLPPSLIDVAKRSTDEILRLCASDMAGSTLSQIALSGITQSLTSPGEFGPYLDDRSHPLFSRFVLLLRRITAFSMSYDDFVSLLRCIAGPLLMNDTDKALRRINLPIILDSNPKNQQKYSKERETDICNRLETLAVIAARGDRVSRCVVGGDDLNTISLYMQKVSVENRLFHLAEQGVLKFVHVKHIDASAAAKEGVVSSPSVSGGNNVNLVADKVWAPFALSGFSYSVWMRMPENSEEVLDGSLFLLDLSTPRTTTSSLMGMGGATNEFFCLWYDIQNQQFCLLTSSAGSQKPTRSPMTPLCSGVWHHILITYAPPKRPMLSRKAHVFLSVDGRPLDVEMKVEHVALPPTATIHFGVPNPLLASSGTVRGKLPEWSLGPTLLFSTILSPKDATSIFAAGPDFEGLFWGDRPQRMSLTATATSAFAALANIGETGSVAGALRRRHVPEVEAAGHVMHKKGTQEDTLDSVGLLCVVSPDDVVFSFVASSNSGVRTERTNCTVKLSNIARVSTKINISSDAFLYGKGNLVVPKSFPDNLQWIGGPNVLMPLVNAVRTSASMALALKLIHESVRQHPPNLEYLQGGGGYRILGLLLRQKHVMDSSVMDQCFAFAVHGFQPGQDSSHLSRDQWVFTDLDAMNHLLLNHQVWDMRRNGPELPKQLLNFLNNLVATRSVHAAFNSRRLHLLGITRWTLHLMLEAAELYDIRHGCEPKGENNPKDTTNTTGSPKQQTRGSNPGGVAWSTKSPVVATMAAGGDPGNSLLHLCKSLLRRILTYMLTPDDLEALAGVIIYTLSINNTDVYDHNTQRVFGNETVPPGGVARIYLLRLLEELVVDGVNEIVSSADKTENDPDGPSDSLIKSHEGGITNLNQSYLTTFMLTQNNKVKSFNGQHPKHQQAQAFLSAFSGILTPVWFACVLEGSQEEASACGALRLMVLMLQSSPIFSSAFVSSGGFSPLVLSIPKFSTCPGINMSMLAYLLHAPILHLPCFGSLDATQLCEVFDLESDATELIIAESAQGGLHTPSDPSCGIFALLAECLGRNIQLASCDNEQGAKARQTNEAVIRLLGHRHTFSSAFQEFCRTSDFLEPLAQALCLVHDEKTRRMISESNRQETSSNPYQRSEDSKTDVFETWPGSNSTPSDMGPGSLGQGSLNSNRSRRRGSLCEINSNITATERFIGENVENESSCLGMVQILRLVLSHSVVKGPHAATLVAALFRSFPIHASLEQVEAFHLVLIEHCHGVVKDALQRGEPIALANCVGVLSVLLDRLMAGFFTSEPVLETVNIALLNLRSLTMPGTYVTRTLTNTDQAILTMDAAHFARLTCLAALQRSNPSGPYDEGDEDLRLAVLQAIVNSLPLLLRGANTQEASSKKRDGTSAFVPPQPGSRSYLIYQSASLTRCSPPGVRTIYRDVNSSEQPDRAFVIALMSLIYDLFRDRRRDIREQAVLIVISLLKERRTFMSDLLITDISRGDRGIETVDLMNRGGFGALMVAHEAATIAENISTVPRKQAINRRGSGSGGMSIGRLRYASFFEWLDRNQGQVAAVFHGIHIQASRVLPSLNSGSSTPEEAIENEQKVMLLKLTSQDSSDRTIQGGMKRTELADSLHDKTSERHCLWRRQGFDDLSSGAMLWKNLLRTLKGSNSLWEGREDDVVNGDLSRAITRTSIDSQSTLDNPDIAKKLSSIDRWKLDLTQGYESQRRRLLPNYEFQFLYKIDEIDNGNTDEVSESQEGSTAIVNSETPSDSNRRTSLLNDRRNDSHWKGSRTTISMSEGDAEATAALVKEMQMRAGKKDRSLFDDYNDDNSEAENDGDNNSDLDEDIIEAAIKSLESAMLSQQDNPGAEEEQTPEESSDQEPEEAQRESDNMFASSYDLITGLLETGDWPEKSYNVKRCTGLEVRNALLLWCREAIYIVDGFEQTEGDGLEGKINRLQMPTSTFDVNLRPHGFSTMESDDAATTAESQQTSAGSGSKYSSEDNAKKKSSHIAGEEITYQHRSQRIAFTDISSVYRRRYQLQQIALEFYDVHSKGSMIAFSSEKEREEVLAKVLNVPLPNSIFANIGLTPGFNYTKFMNSCRTKITNQWVNGHMTNFEFIMHLNSFAGRTYNDLTQYPVFPWVLSDYSSEEIDLEDPNSYRDLSKPMGDQSEARAVQYRERFELLEQNAQMNEYEPPPFHYGTHYSCAAYVLYYLMRLEPYSRLALVLQGGRFDVADRLFHNMEASWKSASSENLQDVRELIPEFFYLPQFLSNSDSFDFGRTQQGKVVHDVTLPPWAKGDSSRFIRIHRKALESNHVSRNLHHWVDLIFGYKQRGREAMKALNTFVHLTYEGEVDLDAITDPIQLEATIAQIHNFGQTPSRLERKPFPQRNVVMVAKEKSIDFNALSTLATLTPPFCVVGAPHRVYLRVSSMDTCRLGMSGQVDASVGDIGYHKGQLIGVGRSCALVLISNKYYRFGGPNNGVGVHKTSTREADKVVSLHDGMHRAPISVARPSLDGEWLVTGCHDSTVRVWKYTADQLHLKASLCGHKKGKITCIDISTGFGTIVTGGSDGKVLVWDMRRLIFLRELKYNLEEKTSRDLIFKIPTPVISVSINHKNGNILALVGSSLTMFDINGIVLATQTHGAYRIQDRPCCAISTDCPEWMENGIVAITGHTNGDVRLWHLDYHSKLLVIRHLVPDKIHSCPITVMGISGQDTLLVGDRSGKMSASKTLRLDCLNHQELSIILREIQSGMLNDDGEVSNRSRVPSILSNENE